MDYRNSAVHASARNPRKATTHKGLRQSGVNLQTANTGNLPIDFDINRGAETWAA